MGTRSTIAVIHAAGAVSQVYCHWDGYLSNNGQILNQFYRTREAVEELVSFGDMSSLGVRAVPVGPHSFAATEEGTTTYYGRDRGEDDTDPQVFENETDYLKHCQNAEYDYLFKDGKWLVSFNGSRPFKDLTTAIERELEAQEE